ncbi:MAG TPA: hypothetical protein VGM98_02910, partial [Schlesneria sp.]
MSANALKLFMAEMEVMARPLAALTRHSAGGAVTTTRTSSRASIWIAHSYRRFLTIQADVTVCKPIAYRSRSLGTEGIATWKSRACDFSKPGRALY